MNKGVMSKCLCKENQSVVNNYIETRNLVLEEDTSYAIGADIKLSEAEEIVNEYLMKCKYEELDKGFANPESFLAGNHFFKVKNEIHHSKVFQMIKILPKGASLHSHDTGMASAEYLYELTFKDNLYGRIKDGVLNLHFFKNEQQGICNCKSNQSEWKSMRVLRTDPNFEDFLKSKLTLVCDQPEVVYPNLNSVWKDFQDLFINVEKLISYKPVFQEYFYQSLKELFDDNICYVEFRGYLPTVYDLDGKEYGPVEVVDFYYETLQQFKRDYPNFFGCSFIFAPHRRVDKTTMNNYIKIYKEIKSKHPDFVIGFDLVGQEDLGEPLISFIPQLLELKDFGCKFFFHAGETNWNGQSSDLNLIDAILLDSVRIGHAFGLLKHPWAAKMVKEKKIAVEVCPISNQVLKLIDDLRSHPAAVLIANNYPVVIGSDDPCFFGSKGICYDWYVTFMALSHRDADLRLLKRLAINSLYFNGLDHANKMLLKAAWENNWALVIDSLCTGTCNCV